MGKGNNSSFQNVFGWIGKDSFVVDTFSDKGNETLFDTFE
jgi:hypothetical protein